MKIFENSVCRLLNRLQPVQPIRMATKLEKALKREITVDSKPHILTIDAEGMKLA